MKRHSIISLILAAFSWNVNAQSGIEKILSDISGNNKAIRAQSHYWEARKIEFRTAYNLYDPTVSYDYMRGAPNVIAGNQTDINLVQRFDFPTVYAKKKNLSEEQGKQAAFFLADQRQEILLQAKTICIELVYRNKMRQQLTDRKAKTEKYLRDFQARLDRGEGNVLDVNKTRLQLIEINKEYQLNLSVINRLNQQLTSLNGGTEVIFTDAEYSIAETVPDFEQLESAIENSDPVRKSLEQQQVISQKEIEVSKTMSLPKLDLGYHYQGILGQNFHGGKIGLSIPLWENKNRVKQKQAELSAAKVQLEDHKNGHYYEIRQLYETYTNLEKTLAEYRSVLGSLNSIELLDKALRAGEISTIEYFLESNYYYEAARNLLSVEKEYHQVIARLHKYQL